MPFFINYFTNVTHSLGLKKKNIELEKPYSKIKEYFTNSESIKKIKESQQPSSFSFKVISEKEVKNAIKDLPIKKTTPSGDISTKVLKQHAQFYSEKTEKYF